MAVEPDCLERRDLLNSSAADEKKLIQAGLDFIERGFLSDAADFLAKAGDEEGLGRVLAAALNEGDLFLFTRTVKALGRPAAARELETLARNAERLGKLSFAAQARARIESAEAESVEGDAKK